MEQAVCAVAVSAATYAFDKLYSYQVPNALQERVQIGVRVLVPFGFGNQRTEGIVLAFRAPPAEIDKLKAVCEVLDDEPILDEAQRQLAAWMCARLYCTYFDCIRVMLPAGLWFRRKETYTLCTEISDQIRQTYTGECAQVLSLFTEVGQTYTMDELRAQYKGRPVVRALDALVEAGVLCYQSNTVQKVTDKTEKMLALAVPFEQALARIGKRSVVRRDVVRALEDGAAKSQKELCYLTGVSDATVRDMVKKGLLCAVHEPRPRTEDVAQVPRVPSPVLSAAQHEVYEGLCALLAQPTAQAALLFGVTGSGKTQVYLKLIERALERGQSAIVLVPEIGLTPQVRQQFAGLFGEQVVVLHSALSAGQRYDSFKKIKMGHARVVVGTRSAVFAPVVNLGVLIIDEEHDSAYQSERTPRYHACEVAKYRVAQSGALLVLGSATPSIQTYYGGMQGKYPIFRLTERFMGTSLPLVELADQRGLLAQGHKGMIGPVLEQGIADTLQKGKQAILFLNRRGNSRVIGCALCGWVPECKQCSVSMSYHSVSGRVVCHYCGASDKLAPCCPVCGGQSLYTESPGTQYVEQELHEKFPSARVLRMDADTMHTKGAHESMLRTFAKGQADLLLGTQMVTKGLDFERVTLVGVLDADQSLYAQDYRACERTFSLITQVVGRAGRRFEQGKAIIQTYSPHHPVLLAAARQDYEGFYERELLRRQALHCPPAADLVIVTAIGKDENRVLSGLLALRERLRGLMNGQFQDVKVPVLGPAPASIVRIQGKYRYHLTMRAPDSARWRTLIAGVLREFLQDKHNKGVTVRADRNPDI